MRPDALMHRSDVVPDVTGGVGCVVAVLALEAVLLGVRRADVRLEGVQLGCCVVALIDNNNKVYSRQVQYTTVQKRNTRTKFLNLTCH